MLLNQKGHDVTMMHDQIRASMHHKEWEKIRPEVVRDLREDLQPGRSHAGKMFQIGERAKHNLGA